jgi:hypothetical protein
VNKISVFGALTKADAADDGTLKIEGIASAEVVDSAGEIVLASAMKAAIPGFLNEGKGALRVMHRSDIAAGCVDSVEVDETTGETRISGTVVDSNVIFKIRKKVLRGLSIGGRITSRDPNNSKVITGVDWRELSLVDRPACGASVLLAKASAASPPGQEPVAGGELAPDQVAAYLSTLNNEDRAKLLITAILRTGTGRKY